LLYYEPLSGERVIINASHRLHMTNTSALNGRMFIKRSTLELRIKVLAFILSKSCQRLKKLLSFTFLLTHSI